jgi:hypothetical protein
MGLILAAVIVGLAAVLLLAFLRPWLPRRPRADEGGGEDLSLHLDRLENIIRRDPYRDDVIEEYRGALERWDVLLAPGERRRRRDFLNEISGRE